MEARKMRSSLSKWIHRNFIVKGYLNSEFNFDCPVCGHKSFYFNGSKLIGFCHRASCDFNPSLRDLISIVGYAPSEGIEDEIQPLQEIEVPEPEIEVELPDSEAIVYYNNRKLLSRYPELVELLGKTRNITPQDINKWNFHTDGHRIYVPVREKGKMVSYVGRVIWGLEQEGEKKYKYPSGSKISNYFFGWDEIRSSWNHLTLVENTFNSIAYRDYFNCSTNFGSHLSPIQLRKLDNSKLECVILLWDEGAEEKAEEAVFEIRKNGIYSTFIQIKGQPDDHPLDEMREIVKDATAAAYERKVCLKVM
jgi:hypothetical protein